MLFLEMRSSATLIFIRMAGDIATWIYDTGVDPCTGEGMYNARCLRDCKLQPALLKFFKPENYFEVCEALLNAGRADLIGAGCDTLIPANPPKLALPPRMEKANKSLTEGKYVHTIPLRADSPAPQRRLSSDPPVRTQNAEITRPTPTTRSL
jgi:hypothetical protein